MHSTRYPNGFYQGRIKEVLIPYQDAKQPSVELPKRQKPHGYEEPKNRRYNIVPEALK